MIESRTFVFLRASATALDSKVVADPSHLIARTLEKIAAVKRSVILWSGCLVRRIFLNHPFYSHYTKDKMITQIYFDKIIGHDAINLDEGSYKQEVGPVSKPETLFLCQLRHTT